MAVYVGLGPDIGLEAPQSHVTHGAYRAERRWLRHRLSVRFALPHEATIGTPIG
jgi:hypothetical protein